MKKLLLFICACTLLSCAKDEDLDNKLANDEVAISEVITTRSVQNSLGYEGSIPIWRYYYYESSTTAGHYFATERPVPEVNGTQKVIKGSTYQYEFSDFNIMKNNYSGYTTPLYRYYSPSGNRFRLSTSANYKSDNYYADYISDGIIGYIFNQQISGTIPLKEIYVPGQKEYSYVSLNREFTWLNTYMSGAYEELGIIGYVYPGKRSEYEGRVPQYVRFVFNDMTSTQSLRGRQIVTITIDVAETIRPGGVTMARTLTYKELYTDTTIELPGAYRIMKIQASINIKDNKNVLRTEVLKVYPHADPTNPWYDGNYVKFWIVPARVTDLFVYSVEPSSGFAL